tara:strand:+ start:73 stop:597 length:525 start_codon:yes stop_codon:yes gene_type:complete
MSKKSKQKGKSWERDVSIFLSELYKESFIRVPGSGAFIGGTNQFRKEYLSEEQIKLSRGDIIPPVKYPFFLAECKNYADFPFHQLISKERIVLLDSWIEQVEHDVTSENDVWLLFIKITRKGTYILYPICKLDDLQHGVRYRQYWFCDMNYFFKCYKDELDLAWRDYGRKTEED